MAVVTECPVCHFRGAASQLNGSDELVCPQCEHVYKSQSLESHTNGISTDNTPDPESSRAAHSQTVEDPSDEQFRTLDDAADARHHHDEGEFMASVAEDQTDSETDSDSKDESDDEYGQEMDGSEDEEGETDEESSRRIIRMRCPNCSNMVELARRSVEVSISVLWDRMQVRNEQIRVRCPVCQTLVQLQRRKSRKSTLPDPVETANPSIPTSNGDQIPKPLTLPDPVPRSPSAAWQLLWPKRFRPSRSPVDATPRPRRSSRDNSRPPLILKRFSFAAMAITTLAAPCAFVPSLGVAVIPLGVLGAIVALACLAVANASRLPRRWAALASLYSCAIPLIAIFYPAGLGEKYNYYRNPELSPEFVRVIPKMGMYKKDAPNDPEWVDASKYGLERDWFHADITSVSIGPVEVRSPAGGPPKVEPHLTIFLFYGRMRPTEPSQTAADDPNNGPDEKVQVTVYDMQGQTYAREDLVLASQVTRGVKLGRYTTATIEEPMIFKAPPGMAELRVEIRVPSQAANPLRFSIPKTMITTRPPRERAPGDRIEKPRRKNDE
jgi:hypothetical protein